MQALVSFFNAALSIMRKAFNPISFLLPWAPAFAALFTVLGLMATAADAVTAGINVLAANVRGLPGSNLVAMANYMFPVSEGLAIYASLLSLRIACVGFRMLKSWIPTIN